MGRTWSAAILAALHVLPTPNCSTGILASRLLKSLDPQPGHPSLVGLETRWMGLPLLVTFALGDRREFVIVIAPALLSTTEPSSKQDWVIVMFPALFSRSNFPLTPLTEISASLPERCRLLCAGTLIVKPHKLPLRLRMLLA